MSLLLELARCLAVLRWLADEVFLFVYVSRAVKPTRYHAVGPLLGRGIFTEDGAFWKQSRGLLRPNFEKHQSSDLEQFERHMEALFALVRRQNASGRLDLADVLGRLVMDTSAEFLMGMGTGALGAGSGNGRAGRFVRDMDVGMRDAALHWRLGWLYGLWPHAEARRAVQGARVFVEGFVQRAVEKAAKGEEEGWKEGKGKYVFIDELAKRKEVDVDRIRDEAMNVILAGMDTTAALLSNLWFFLVRNQEVWEKLKAEVDALEGELPTYEKLRNMKFIKYCAQESEFSPFLTHQLRLDTDDLPLPTALRLFPPAPLLAKIAIRPTTLPHGGGPDGKSPIFIPKGATANYVSYSLMRSPEVYGPDPDTWRPSRWEDPNLRPGWSYLAFGGGPRVCLGQQYALTETYYVTIRLMQEFGKGFEVRDEEWEWREKFQITMSSANGVKVGLRE